MSEGDAKFEVEWVGEIECAREMEPRKMELQRVLSKLSERDGIGQDDFILFFIFHFKKMKMNERGV